MQENYLAKWLNNELTEEEITQFKQTEEYTSYLKIKEVSDKLQAPDFDIEKTLEVVANKRNSNQPKVIKLNPMKKFIRVAAAIVLLCGASYFYISSLDETVRTNLAQTNEIILPDASEIILNAESKIAYSKKNWDKKRNVSLEGEAFFKVAKGKKFTVSTDHGTVTVLGTQFNVENRPNFFEVTCYEGLVSVDYNEETIQLPAGKSFHIISGKVFTDGQIKATSPSWTNNESSFKSIPLQFVLNEFQRQYNIKVETKNIDTKQLFTGTFSNKNIDLALQSISLPSQILFKLEENKVLFYAEK